MDATITRDMIMRDWQRSMRQRFSSFLMNQCQNGKRPLKAISQ